jgi:MFS family permease
MLATAGLFGIVFGLIRGNSHGWTSAQVLTGLVGGGLLIAAFVESVLGYTPLAAGLHGLPRTAAPAVTAPVAGLLSDRLGGRRIVAIGVALQAIGIGWLATVITPTISYADLVPPFLIAGAGLGFFFAPITQLTLRYAPGELEGIASGTSNALRQVGMVLGVAVLGSVFSATGGLDSPGQIHRGPDQRSRCLRRRTRSGGAGGPAGPGDSARPAGHGTLAAPRSPRSA